MRMVVSLLFAALAVAQDPSPVPAELTAAAAALPGIDYGDLAYGRYGAGFSTPGPGLDEVARLAELAWPRADLEGWLRHAEPKVRTLAMVLLFAREEFSALPRIAALLDDAAPTIPCRTPELVAGPQLPAAARTIDSPRTVGEVAGDLLGIYWAVLDYRGPRDAAGFAAFWQPRAGRATTIGWLRLRLLRAHGGVTPVQAACRERVRGVRRAVDVLASPDRELALLGAPDLTFDPTEMFAADAERIAAARALGDEVLLACLAGHFPSDDPDLPQMFCRDGVFGTSSTLHRFVLDPDHAIFAPSAAPRLLELEREQWRLAAKTTGNADAGWIAVAASLQPEHAVEWIGNAFGRGVFYDGQQAATLLRVLVKVGGEAAERLVVKRFWQQGLVQVYGVYPRLRVLDAIPARPRADALRLLRALARAPEFAGADAATMLAFGEAVAQVLGSAPFDLQAARDVRHPLGLTNLVTTAQRQAARAQYPADTERLESALARWRAATETALAGG